MSFLNKLDFMKVVFLFSFLMCAGCGPGAKDGSTHISHGYYFSHLGGQQNLIEHIDGDESEIVIKAKVEDFLLRKDKIYVSRIPVAYQNNNGVLKSTLGKDCEYWVIDLINKSVQGPIEKREVSQLINGCKWLKY